MRQLGWLACSACSPMCTPKICDKALVFSLFQLKKRKLDETNTGNMFVVENVAYMAE